MALVAPSHAFLPFKRPAPPGPEGHHQSLSLEPLDKVAAQGQEVEMSFRSVSPVILSFEDNLLFSNCLSYLCTYSHLSILKHIITCQVQCENPLLSCFIHMPICFFLNTSCVCEYTQTPQQQGLFFPAETDSHVSLYAPSHAISVSFILLFPRHVGFQEWSVSGLGGIVRAMKYLIYVGNPSFLKKGQ